MINMVMVARDRNRLTSQAIESLIEHTDEKKYNLMLVDDCSLEKQKSWGWPTIRLDTSHHVLGALKNLGIYWSQHHFGRGDWLYLSDNDVYFMEGWAQKLICAMTYAEKDGKYTGFKLLGGQNHPYHQPIMEVSDTRLGFMEHQALAGTSWLMHWETWDKYGPLVETGAPGVGQSEDHEFCQRIRKDGFKVGAVYPHVVLDTGITQTGGGLSPGHEAKKVAGVYYE